MTDQIEENEFSNNVHECKMLYLDIKEDIASLSATLDADAENVIMDDPTWRHRATRKLIHLNAERLRLYHWLVSLGCTDFAGSKVQIRIMSDAHKRKVKNMQEKHEMVRKEQIATLTAVFDFISSEFGHDALQKAYDVSNAAQEESRKQRKPQ